MKNQFYYILICIASLTAATGCKKFLVHDNPTEITDDKWWNTEQDAANALDVLYGGDR
jgi:hypothetical protein